MSTKEKFMSAFRRHPKLTTLILGLGITLVIGIVTGISEPKLVYATGSAGCDACFSF